MGSNPRQLTVATADDAPELVELYFDAFSGDEYHDNVFPRGVGDEYHLKAWTGFLTPEEGVLKPMVFLVRGGESGEFHASLYTMRLPFMSGLRSFCAVFNHGLHSLHSILC